MKLRQVETEHLIACTKCRGKMALSMRGDFNIPQRAVLTYICMNKKCKLRKDFEFTFEDGD